MTSELKSLETEWTKMSNEWIELNRLFVSRKLTQAQAERLAELCRKMQNFRKEHPDAVEAFYSE